MDIPMEICYSPLCMPKEVPAPQAKSEVPQGTLDLMVLQTLDAMASLHGYGIARRIEQTERRHPEAERGNGLCISPPPPTEGLDFRGTSANNRKAKFYALTNRAGSNWPTRPMIGGGFRLSSADSCGLQARSEVMPGVRS
jgi:PadR family transcriptional regulator PadR